MVVAAAGTASAKVTSPEADSVIRSGDVRIVEDAGGAYGTNAALCALGANHADSRITVTREDDGTVVFDKLKGSAGAWEATWSTDGLPGGTYRIKSTSTNVALVTLKCTKSDTVVSDFTVVLRPWQHKFTDITKRATVYLNTEGTKEYGVKIDGQVSRPVEVPKMTVLQDRFVAVHDDSGDVALTGTFDLQTGVFTGIARLNGRTVALGSAGSVDQQADGIRGQLAALAAQAGVDLEKLLATKVAVRAGSPSGARNGIDLSLGDGIALVTDSHDPDGIAVGPTALSAGLVMHLYVNIGAGSQLANNVSDTGLPALPKLDLPAIPVELPSDAGLPEGVSATDLLSLIGQGPVIQVKGKYQTGKHATGTAILANVDTTPGSPGGLAWLPGVSGGLVDDHEIDYIGHGTVVQDETCMLGICIAYGVLFGDGAAQYNGSPLPLPELAKVTGGLKK
jgi:hypothetical protein